MGMASGNFGRKMYLNPDFGRKISESLKYKITEVIKICPKCNREFNVERKIDKRGNEIIYRKEKKYCCRKCSNSHTLTNITKDKISKKLNKKINIICLFCKKEFIGHKDRKFCNNKCARKYRTEISFNNLTKYNKYKKECQFNFSINKYINKFDFSLIKKYGWYKAKNRGDNMNGVSRDHIISINYGFKNNILPEIISHPANCQLLPHLKNISKGKNNGMTIEQLIDKINNWE